MPMSEYEKKRLMPEVISKAKMTVGERQYEKLRSDALIRLDKAMKYAQVQKNDPCILGRYSDQRYWDGYLAALEEMRHLL